MKAHSVTPGVECQNVTFVLFLVIYLYATVIAYEQHVHMGVVGLLVVGNLTEALHVL